MAARASGGGHGPGDEQPDEKLAVATTDPFFPWGAWNERVKASEIAPVQGTAFGEQVPLFDGQTGFSVAPEQVNHDQRLRAMDVLMDSIEAVEKAVAGLSASARPAR